MENRLSDELIQRARLLSEILTTRGTQHAFIGGLAMNVWAVPVPTFDIDLCAALAPEEIPALLRVLETAGFIPPPTPWIEAIGSVRLQEFTVHWPYGLGVRPADIFLATDAFQQAALSRRRRVELEAGFWADVVTPEDLLVYKLIAWRNKDRAAIDRLLAVHSSLDWECVRQWTHRFGIEDRLEQARRDADPAPEM